MNLTIALVAGYVLGSIPFGYLLGRLRGIDLRAVGSGNIGAANAFRNLGRSWGLLTMALDIGKGVAGAVIGRWLVDDAWPIAAGAAVMIGSIFPIWMRFKGGKGVAAAGGVVIGLLPWVALVLLPLWLLVVAIWRITSLAAIVASLAFTPLTWLFGYSWEYIVLAAVMSVLVLVRHRSNIGRLLNGSENRIHLGKGTSTPTDG